MSFFIVKGGVGVKLPHGKEIYPVKSVIESAVNISFLSSGRRGLSDKTSVIC